MKKKAGRPRKKEKVTLMAAYLLPKEKRYIVKKYGSLTAGVRSLLLEKDEEKNI